MIERVTESAGETRALGRRLGKLLCPGSVVMLFGELGSGKTTFVQGIADGMGAWESVTSPTFTLVHEYATDSGKLIHMDPYRLNTEEDLMGIGFPDMLESGAVLVIEWGERLGSLIPSERIEARIEVMDGERRSIKLLAIGAGYRSMLEQGNSW